MLLGLLKPGGMKGNATSEKMYNGMKSTNLLKAIDDRRS